MNHATAITEDSLKITGRGIILELRHSEEGLPKDTELTSEKSGFSWKIIARVLFDHAVHEQRVFESESVEYMLMRFENPEKQKESIERIRERDKRNIFLYFLKPIGHETQPLDGEELKIRYAQQEL